MYEIIIAHQAIPSDNYAKCCAVVHCFCIQTSVNVNVN